MRNAATSSSRRNPAELTASREQGAGEPMFQAGHWCRGNPPDARISAAQIRYRGRCRRIAASWRRKSLAALFSEDLMDRLAARRICHSHQKVPQSAGPVCGSGKSCQHRSCHCPRQLSFAETASQRATAHEGCVSFEIVSAAEGFGSWSPRRRSALSTRERLKSRLGLRTAGSLRASHL